MPLYEYACRACGHRFEVLQRLGAGARGLSCPSCGAVRPGRELSTFATAATAPDAACAAPAPGFGCACNPGRDSCP